MATRWRPSGASSRRSPGQPARPAGRRTTRRGRTRAGRRLHPRTRAAPRQLLPPGLTNRVRGRHGGCRTAVMTTVMPPTPPPDIDVLAWHASVARILAWQPEALFLTHFGPVTAVAAHFARTARPSGGDAAARAAAPRRRRAVGRRAGGAVRRGATPHLQAAAFGNRVASPRTGRAVRNVLGRAGSRAAKGQRRSRRDSTLADFAGPRSRRLPPTDARSASFRSACHCVCWPFSAAATPANAQPSETRGRASLR